MPQSLSEWPPPPTWILVCTHWVNPSPFKKDTPPHPPTDTVSQFTVAVAAPLHRRPGLPSPLLSYLLRSPILHKLPLCEDNKPYLPSMSSITHRCNTFMEMVAQLLCECNKDIMTINQCYFTPLVVEAIWETLRWANHILSMGTTSSISSLYLRCFALITCRGNYRVEEDRHKHYQMTKRFSRLCKLWKVSYTCSQNCLHAWVQVHTYNMSLCCTDYRY